jgi:hypothetical protein
MRAQMREKAAASKLRKENIPTNSNSQSSLMSNSQSSLMSAGKRNLPSVQSALVPDTLGATIKQGFLKKAKVSKVSSPMDTYEISDREDSDTDDSGDSDDEKKAPGKKVRLCWFRDLYASLMSSSLSVCTSDPIMGIKISFVQSPRAPV